MSDQISISAKIRDKINISAQPIEDILFLPSDITGLDMWLDSDVGITEDGSNNVSIWDDFRGSSNHSFLQATGANQANRVANQINGHAIIDFNGTTDFLKEVIANWLSTSTSGTFFIVAQHISVAVNRYLSSADEASTTRFFQLRSVLDTGFDFIGSNIRNNDTADRIFGDTRLQTVNPYIGVIESTGTSYKLRINKADETVNVQSGNDNGDWLADTDNRDNILIAGLERSILQVSELKVANMLMYNTQISTANRASVEKYLSDRYSITA